MAQLFSPDPLLQSEVPPEAIPVNEEDQLGDLGEDVFVLPASFAQQRLWFLEQWEPGVYNISLAVGLIGNADINALERACNEIIRRHEALRTTFRMVDSNLLQIVFPHMPCKVSTIDLSMFPDDVRVMKTRRLIHADFQQPFDLTNGPLLRVTMLKSKPQRHNLILSMHHIISDGWSMEVLFDEIKTLYTAYVSGKESPLPDLPIQYADYAIWQRDWLQGALLEEEIDYWRQQLADLTVLQLPFDRPRPAIQTFRGAVRTMVIPSELYAALNTLSRQAGVTLFMTLMGAYQTLLFRYTDQTSIPVGTPIAGRNESKLEPLIGCFINTLVMRTDFSGNPTFWELLKRVREVALGAYEHQDVPFEKLVEALQPDRDLSHNPLTQVMFALQNVPQRETMLPGLQIVNLDLVEHNMQEALGTNNARARQHLAMAENKTAMFDLDMTIWERGDILFGELKYNTDLFDPETIDRFYEHFMLLLESVVANPMQRVSDIPLLTSEEQLALQSWNETQVGTIPYGSDHFLDDFLAQVARTPNALAVRDEYEQASYEQLHSRSDQMAAHLLAHGIQSEDVIGLYTHRSVLWAISVLAILKVGAVYLPLDPHYPAARLHTILQQSQCRLLLTPSSLLLPLLSTLSTLPETVPELLCIGTLLNTEPPSNIVLPAIRDRRLLAYLIFTSGSTGTPKGVMLEHGGMYNHLHAKRLALELDQQDVIAQTASHCFDISLWQLLCGWLVGAQVRIYPDWLVADPHTLLQQIEQDEVSILEVVPSWLDVALEHPHTPALARLRWLIPTGEALPVDLCQRWLQRYPQIPLLNAYGPTECSDDVTHQIIAQPPEAGQWASGVPIGSALPNLQLYVLDRQGQPQPIGVWGELYIGGVGVGRGYVGLPTRTATAFVPDPFSAQPGARLYRSGDLARYRPDGSLEFQGRLDQQVKLRGYRIELGEVEQVLRQLPGVRQSVVALKTDAQGQQRLVGYVVLHQEAAFSFEEVQQTLREALPDYMVPAAIVPLEALPLSANGKLDQQRLPEPQFAHLEEQAEYVAPRTPLEEQLAAIWSDLLGIERVSIHDDFFALGGHSLLTVRLMTLIEQRFGRRLPLVAIFQGRTIEALAGVLERYSETALWASNEETQLPMIDLQLEATLDLETCPEIWADHLPAAPTNVLLTGATGFLGTFLLAELLRTTQANVYCLIRATDREQGKSKLQKILEEAGEWQPEFSPRIIPVIGDLAQPRLGLSRQAFDELAREVDTIYHNGALVNMLYPYEQLKPANVDGTREIIRLATTHRIKPLHYVSTLSVFPYTGENKIQQVREQEALDEYSEHVRGGYAQSKWVAEKIVAIARSRGLPVVIYRPGRITGHSQSGVWRSDDVICHMIKACIQMGKGPILREEDVMELLPVDYVSKAIVALSLRKASLNQSFHLCDPTGAKVNDIIQWVSDYGYRLEAVEYGAWLEELVGLINADKERLAIPSDNAASQLAHAQSPGKEDELSPFLSLFLQPQARSSAAPTAKVVHTNRYTVNALARASVHSPQIDARLLHVYLSYMVKNGFLPAPACHAVGLA